MNINKAYQKALRVIQTLINHKKQVFLIYPYSTAGRIIKAALNFDCGIQELCCVQNMEEESAFFAKEQTFTREKVTVLLALDNKLPEDECSNYRHDILSRYHFSQVVDVFSPSVYFDEGMFDDDSYYTHSRKMFMESCSREIYINNVQGSIAECGVYQGDSAVILNELFPDRELFLFDTFSGYDESDMTRQEYDSWGEYMMFCHKRFSVTPTIEALYQRMPWRDRVHIMKGHFPDTAVDNNEIANRKYALVNLDMNLYLPMKAGLEIFWPKLSPGGILLVDDIRHKGLPSARKAFDEFCKAKGVSYATITYDGMGMAAVSKNLYLNS